jgi:hypothetical protein
MKEIGKIVLMNVYGQKKAKKKTQGKCGILHFVK